MRADYEKMTCFAALDSAEPDLDTTP